MKLYHGTNNYFDKFSIEYLGSNTEWENCQRGIYLTDEIGIAQMFGSTVYECEVELNRCLDLHDIYGKVEQATDIVEIIFLERIDDPEEALEFIVDNVGLGDHLDFLNNFDSQDIIRSFAERGYDHTLSRFAENKIEYCVFDPEKIAILENDVISKYTDKDFLSPIPVNSFQHANLTKALESRDERELHFIAKQIQKNINSIPDQIDGISIDNVKKMKILADQDRDFGFIGYSIKGNKLFRELNGLLDAASPVLRISTSEIKHSLVRKMSI